MKFSSVVSVTVISAAMGMMVVGCGGDGGGNGSAPGAQVTTQQEQDKAKAEVVQLNSYEEDLARVGLKFKEGFTIQNGLSTQTVSWDQAYLDQFAKDHPEITIKDMIVALQKFVDDANGILTEWGDRLLSKDEIKLKVDLAQKTISKLNQPGN